MTLELSGVGRRYGDVWGVRDVSLELDDGVVGLLGPNGAGKSTLLRIVSTVIAPTEGTVTYDGVDVTESPGAVRSVLGYLPQDVGVYPSLSAAEFLRYVAALKGVDGAAARDRVDELLELVNLQSARDRRLETFSGGMIQRVGVASALLNDPELLVVDEPTVGLDPEERVRFRNVLAELADDRLVVLSTHIVPDVEATATEVAIMADGRLLAHATPGDLLAGVEGDVWEWVVPEDRLPAVNREYVVSNTARRSDGVAVRVVADEPPGEDATPQEPSLEDAYLSLVEGDRRPASTGGDALASPGRGG